MVKKNTVVKRKRKNTKKIKRLYEQHQKTKFNKLEEEELNLFEQDKQLSQEEQQQPEEKIQIIPKDKSRWVDENDEVTLVDLSKTNRLRKLMKNDEKIISGQEYSTRLRQYYNRRIERTNFLQWANKDRQSDSEESQQLPLAQILQTLPSEQQQITNALDSSLIEIKKIGFVKPQDRADAVVQSIAFHPNLPIFATGAYDKVLRIYQIHAEKKDNQVQLIKKIYLEKFPINEVCFMNKVNEIIISSFQKSFLISYDLFINKTSQIKSTLFSRYEMKKIYFFLKRNITQGNKFNKEIRFKISENDDFISVFNDTGYIHILNGKNKSFLFEFKQNETCLTCIFYQEYLFSAGLNGKIYQWNLNTKRIHDVIQCPGANQINSLDFKMNHLAAGCRTGIVNIFKFEKINAKLNKTPIKEVQNLLTSVDQVKFNSYGELLCLSSKWKPNAVRLLHVDSLNVYPNWPNFKTNLKNIHSSCFSSDSRYIVFGNEAGEVNVYRLLHY